MREDGHLPATKADLRDFATKADLRDFATKADLRDFATKADLRDFATKADLRDFATKADLRDFATSSDLHMLKADVAALPTKEDLRDMLHVALRPIVATLANHTAELADIRTHIKDKLVTRDEFYSTMDGYARRVENSDYSSAKNLVRLDDHEKRIDALEKRA